VDRVASHVFTYSRIIPLRHLQVFAYRRTPERPCLLPCHNRPFKNPAVCPITSIREEQLEAAVLDVLQRVQLSNAELSLAKKYLAQRRTDVEQQGAQMRMR